MVEYINMQKVYNTLTQKKEELKPIKGKKINLFVCGPTTYDDSHIGHARTYIAFDMIVKYLRATGFSVDYLQNITDIDDKIIERAQQKNITPDQLAKEFEKKYLDNMRDLNVDSITKYAKATKHIKKIVNQIRILLQKRYAYRTRDGIYYDISRFKGYGKLSGRTVLQAEDAVSRIDESEHKKHKGDFVLWKFAKEGEPQWESPFGKGRPGWHIEDTAITEKYFGDQYDIHGGARDLIFPHHEAEIAQMEAISGKTPLVKYWMHSGFLTVKGKKMAKSQKNFITIDSFLKEHSPRLLRLIILKNHYRSPVDYNNKIVKQAQKELERLDEFTDKLNNINSKAKTKNLVKTAEKEFEVAMTDDFNTPKALAAIFNLTSKGNTLISKNQLSTKEAKEILSFLKQKDKVFSFILFQKPEKDIPKDVQKLVKTRERHRKNNKWKEADKVRVDIKKKGYLVQDSSKGPVIKKV